MNSHLVNTHLFPGESIVTSSCDEAIVISYSLSVLRAHGISIFIVFAIWHSIKVCRNASTFFSYISLRLYHNMPAQYCVRRLVFVFFAKLVIFSNHCPTKHR